MPTVIGSVTHLDLWKAKLMLTERHSARHSVRLKVTPKD